MILSGIMENNIEILNFYSCVCVLKVFYIFACLVYKKFLYKRYAMMGLIFKRMIPLNEIVLYIKNDI